MVDGVVKATEAKTLNIKPDCAITVGDAYDSNSTVIAHSKLIPSATLFFSGALANLKVYSVAIPPGDLAILTGTPVDMKKDNVINFKDLALFAKKWQDILLFP
jgi:hypothetical protein